MSQIFFVPSSFCAAVVV
jgi:hypothetical protein